MKKLIALFFIVFLFSCEGTQENIIPALADENWQAEVIGDGGGPTDGGGTVGGGGNGGGGTILCNDGDWSVINGGTHELFPQLATKGIGFLNHSFDGHYLCTPGKIKVKVTNLPAHAELEVNGNIIGYGGPLSVFYEIWLPAEAENSFLHTVEINYLLGSDSGTEIDFEVVEVTGASNELSTTNGTTWTFKIL